MDQNFSKSLLKLIERTTGIAFHLKTRFNKFKVINQANGVQTNSKWFDKIIVENLNQFALSFAFQIEETFRAVTTI